MNQLAEDWLENDGGHSFESDFQALQDFIKELPNANDVDKAWNLKDGKKRLSEGVPLQELKDKYWFYDEMAFLRDQILQNVPLEKRSHVLNEINGILNESLGHQRYLKLARMKEVLKAVEVFRRDQSLLRHKMWRAEHHLGQGVRVLKILISEDQARFKKEYEGVFTSKFWGNVYGLFSRDYPNFVRSFPFSTEEELLLRFKGYDELGRFLTGMKSSAEKDVINFLGEFFSDSDQARYISEAKGISDQSPEKMVLFLHKLHDAKEKNKDQAKEGFARVGRLASSGDVGAALSEWDSLTKKFGSHLGRSLGVAKFIRELEVTHSDEERIKNELKTAKGKKKDQLREKLKKVDPTSLELDRPSDSSQKEKQILDIESDINSCLSRNDFGSARSAARRLRGLDSARYSKEIDQIRWLEKKHREEPDSDVDSEDVDMSTERQTKRLFYDKCLYHMEQVSKKCSELKIPDDGPEFWGIEGVRNRVKRLKDMGKFSDYKRFNASDPHVPSTEQAGGFKFRWLDLKTGTSLTGASAQAGIKFLDRFKDSGYELAALAGAFSINWRSSDDPVYSPREFVRVIQAERAKV